MAETTKYTEATMLALLASRYGKQSGNGPAWAFIPQVRNAAAFDATRTIDAIAMGLWPSRGLELHGHEIKVSRSDWLRELKDPAKAEQAASLVDRWWVVVPDAKIVAAGELPPTWGLMVASGNGLRALIEAPKLEHDDADWMPRTFLAALLRASVRTSETTPLEIQAAIEEARANWDETHAAEIDSWRSNRDNMAERIRAFEDASGLSIGGAWMNGKPERAAEVGAAVKLVLEGKANLEFLEQRYINLAAAAERLAADIRENLPKEKTA